jgi:type I restriction enzyme, S subunit
MNGLPKGWEITALRELLVFKYGKGLTQDNRNRQGPVNVFGSNGVVGLHDTAITQGPTVIVGRKGSVGEVHFSQECCWPIDTTYFIDEFPGNIPPLYWVHYIKSLQLGQRDKSSAIPGISRDDIYEVEVAVPPLNEQHRIVAKLEELLGKVDACKKRLERIPVILKRFRQSVLAAACSGRLTADWREQKQTETPGGELEDAPEGFNPLPDTWYWKPLEAVCRQIVDCPHSTPKWTEKGRICVRTTNFKPGVLDLQNIQYVSDETFTKRIERLKPQPGDIIYSREGGILGIACMIPPETAICLGQRMMLFRAKTDYQAVLLMHWLNSPLILNRVRELTGGSAAPHLNVRDIKNFPTPCPPPDEQHEIVSRVDALFNIAGQIEERYTQAKSHMDKLTQSILAKAFRGELVPQNPNDEPASVLLERIHVDLKAASHLSTKPQRTKASQQKKRNRKSIRHGATA